MLLKMFHLGAEKSTQKIINSLAVSDTVVIIDCDACMVSNTKHAKDERTFTVAFTVAFLKLRVLCWPGAALELLFSNGRAHRAHSLAISRCTETCLPPPTCTGSFPFGSRLTTPALCWLAKCTWRSSRPAQPPETLHNQFPYR